MKYFVEYNGKYLAAYKTLRGVYGFIRRKRLKDDADNSLRVITQNGDEIKMPKEWLKTI